MIIIKRFGVVIGIGSVGSKHFQILQKFFPLFILIDPLIKNRILKITKKRRLTIEKYLNLNTLTKDLSDAVCVISNWGPDHYAALDKVTKLSAKTVVLEKPVASSLKDLKKIEELKDVKIFVNIPFDYTNASKKIKESGLKYNTGDLLSINIVGGAKCLATTGIHYVTMGLKLFESLPDKILSDVKNTKGLNPRSNSLAYLEGQLIIKFPLNRSLIMNFSNSGKLHEFVELEFEHGRMFIQNYNAELLVPKIKGYKTRTETPEKKIMSAKLMNVKNNAYLNDFYKQIIYKSISPNIDIGIQSTKILIAGLIASREKKSITFPINKKLSKKYFDYDWRIS